MYGQAACMSGTSVKHAAETVQQAALCHSPAAASLAVKLPFMDSLVMRSSSAVCCAESGEVGVMVPEDLLAAIWARLSSKFCTAHELTTSRQQVTQDMPCAQ